MSAACSHCSHGETSRSLDANTTFTPPFKKIFGTFTNSCSCRAISENKFNKVREGGKKRNAPCSGPRMTRASTLKVEISTVMVVDTCKNTEKLQTLHYAFLFGQKNRHLHKNNVKKAFEAVSLPSDIRVFLSFKTSEFRVVASRTASFALI